MCVPLYTTLIPEQIAYILNDAEARLVFVSTMAHLETILSIRDRLPTLEKVVVFYPDELDEDDFVISLDTLKELGQGHGHEEFGAGRQARPADPATFVYTSGTTGNPKGVVLSHGNFMAEFEAVAPLFEGGEGDIADLVPAAVPHPAAGRRLVRPAVRHVTMAYAESLDTLGENLREVRPTHIVAVPRVYEKIHGRIHEGVQKGSALKRALFNWAVGRRPPVPRAEARARVPAGRPAHTGSPTAWCSRRSARPPAAGSGSTSPPAHRWPRSWPSSSTPWASGSSRSTA